MKREILLAIFFCSCVIAFGQDTYLHCGNIIDTGSGKILNEMTIVVSGKKIKSLEKGYTDPKEGDVVIDLKDKTVLPGLIDMHVHIEGQSSPKRRCMQKGH